MALTKSQKSKAEELILNVSYEIGENLNEKDKLKEDLGYDSLDLIELIMEFEKEFSISISDSEAENVKTVKDVYDLLNLKLIKN